MGVWWYDVAKLYLESIPPVVRVLQ